MVGSNSQSLSNRKKEHIGFVVVGVSNYPKYILKIMEKYTR